MKNRNKITGYFWEGKIQAALIMLLALLMFISVLPAAYAADEEPAEPSLGEVFENTVYEAASAAAESKGVYLWRVTQTGEAVKCKGGTLVAPAGDPEAQAPEIEARGAAMYSYDLGRIVYSKNENERLEPYSTTKLLTCWLALQNLDPDTVVTVSAKATQVYENGTTIWLKEGEQITVRDLIYGAMLESGNDAAYALGEAVSGSEADFADLMNKTVEKWGCKDTHFVNANGWKNDNHYTTAGDMAVITAKCLENEQLREISTTKKYTTAATNMTGARELRNYLLYVTGNPKGLTGGKTGTWEDDDCAVVVSFSEGGLESVIVLLGDTEDGRPVDVRKLKSFSHSVTPGFIVPEPGATVKTAWVKHGEKTRTELAVDSETLAYPSSDKARDIRTEIRYNDLEAPIVKGTEVGEFLVYSDNELIGEHKLITTENIETGWLPSYLYISNKATLKALLVIGVFILLLFLVSRIGRVIRHNKKKRKKTSRKTEAPGSMPSDTVKESKSSPPDSKPDKKITAKSSRKDKKETRQRLREKYRDKH